jgi:hypothetical protein
MIAMQLAGPAPSRRQAPVHQTAAAGRENEQSGVVPPDAPATVSAQFRPLDPGIVSETIPAFFIGRNKEGFWIARDVNGQIGGIFLLENSALSFARRKCRPAGCATIYPSETIELDLDNGGNPLIGRIGPLIRVATRHRRRTAAFLARMLEAIKRRLKEFHVF